MSLGPQYSAPARFLIFSRMVGCGPPSRYIGVVTKSSVSFLWGGFLPLGMCGRMERYRVDVSMGALLEFTQQQLERSPSGDALWRGLPEFSVAGHQIIRPGSLESGEDREILFVPDAAPNFTDLLQRWIPRDEHASVLNGHQPPSLIIREPHRRTTEELLDFPADVFDRDKIAGAVPAEIHEETLVAAIEQSADKGARVNEQLHDTASSRRPS